MLACIDLVASFQLNGSAHECRRLAEGISTAKINVDLKRVFWDLSILDGNFDALVCSMQ